MASSSRKSARAASAGSRPTPPSMRSGALPKLSEPAEKTISEVAEQTGVPIARIKF